jgi:hypothetical protein
VLNRFLEVAEVIGLTITLNRARSRRGPKALTSSLRSRAMNVAARSPEERARLQRVIRVVDKCFPTGPNCYRRALVEIAMDAGAASEGLHLGLMAAGGRDSGHAWLASWPEADRRYDAELVV